MSSQDFQRTFIKNNATLVKYPDKIVSWAGPALFVDILGLGLAIWKIVLNPSFSTRLEPVTKAD